MKKIYTFSCFILFAGLIYGILCLYNTEKNKIENFKCKDCNVIVISLNYLRKDHLPCFGYFRNTARDICELAEKSILFENFINQSYLTPMSQMSIFTSMYLSNLNYLFFHSDVEKKFDTFPEILKKNNYYTAAFGSSPMLMPNQANSEVHTYVENSKKLQFSNGFDLYEYVRHFDNPYPSLNWLKGKRGGGKFFLWLPISTLHWPYALWGPNEHKGHFVDQNYSGVFKEYEFIPGELILNIYKDIYYNQDSQEVVQLDDMDKEYIISKYDYDLIYLNYYIRKLVNILKEQNLLDKTLLVLHGSHGVALSEHGYFTAYDIYDTEVNTMMMIYNPVLKNRHLRIKNQIRGLDFSPTVLDILDISVPENMLGISLNKYLPDNVPDDLVAFTERVPPLEIQFLKNNRRVPKPWLKKIEEVVQNKKIWADTSIRTNKWKLIHRRFKKFEEDISLWKLLSGKDFKRREYELYNVIKDPMNLKNVIDLHPNVFKELKKLLDKWERENTDAFFAEF